MTTANWPASVRTLDDKASLYDLMEDGGAKSPRSRWSRLLAARPELAHLVTTARIGRYEVTMISAEAWATVATVATGSETVGDSSTVSTVSTYTETVGDGSTVPATVATVSAAISARTTDVAPTVSTLEPYTETVGDGRDESTLTKERDYWCQLSLTLMGMLPPTKRAETPMVPFAATLPPRTAAEAREEEELAHDEPELRVGDYDDEDREGEDYDHDNDDDNDDDSRLYGALIEQMISKPLKRPLIAGLEEDEDDGVPVAEWVSPPPVTRKPRKTKKVRVDADGDEIDDDSDYDDLDEDEVGYVAA